MGWNSHAPAIRTRFGSLSRHQLGCLSVPVVLGLMLGVAGFTYQKLQATRVQRNFVQTHCTVLDKRLHTETHHRGRSGITHRVSRKTYTYRPEILIEYQVQGQSYELWTYHWRKVSTSDLSRHRAVLDRFEIDRQYPCWYDPLDRGRAVLTRDSGGERMQLVYGLFAGMMGIMFVGFFLVIASIFRNRRSLAPTFSADE